MMILHQWSFCMPDAEESISNILMKKVVELFVNIHGFAFASSSCAELYKQANKKECLKSIAHQTQFITQLRKNIVHQYVSTNNYIVFTLS